MIFFDSETRGRPDLTRVGAYRYWADLDSEIILGCWADDKKEKVHSVREIENATQLIMRLVKGESLVVQNLQFERLAIMMHGLDIIDWSTQVQDTAAMARAMALPAHLDALARCIQFNLNLPVSGKDIEGRRMMLRFCKPDNDGNWYWNDEAFKTLTRYCKQDVKLTKFVYKALEPLPPDEHRQMVYTERMNARGIKLDMTLAKTLVAMIDEEKQDIDKEMRQLTNFAVDGASKVQQLKLWLAVETGKAYPTIGADLLRELLTDEDHPLFVTVRRVLELRLLGSKTSVSKIQKLIDAADPDDHRVRGMFLYCGAGATGRWSSRIVQLHNLPRAGYGESTENIIDLIHSAGPEGLRLMFGTVMNELPKLIRSLLIADEGKHFISGDFAGIEARILAWMAGDKDKVKMYVNDVDTYLVAAEKIGYPGNRQLGKTCELALGYNGGVSALGSMAAKFSVDIEASEQDRIVKEWRKANHKTVKFWADVSAAAHKAMEEENVLHCVGTHTTLGYFYDGFHLWCQLPSGRRLCYPFAKRNLEDTRFGNEWEITATRGNRTPAAGEAEWPRIVLWPGILVENICQAIGADLLRWMVEVSENNKLSLVLHVHDEVLLEENTNVTVDHVTPLFKSPPDWAKGLPLDIKWWSGPRYRK